MEPMSDQPLTKTGVWSRRTQVASAVSFAGVAVIATTWNINEPNLALLETACLTVIGSVGVVSDRLTIEWLQASLNKPRHAAFKVLQGVAGAVATGGALSAAAHEVVQGKLLPATGFAVLAAGAFLFSRYRVKRVWQTVDALQM